MSRSVRGIAIAALSIFLCVPNSVSAEGWSWNPFSSKKSSSSATTSQSFSSYKTTDTSKSWLPSWKVPTFSWQRKQSNSYTAKSTAWQRMSKTSKRWWNKTTDALNPYPSESKPASSDYLTTTKPKSSYFSGWFGKPEKKDEFSSVSDFLKQPSPQ